MAMNTDSGTTPIDADLLADMVRKIVKVSAPERIILFGSAASGDLRPGSDIDLLVLKPAFLDRRAEYLAIRRAISGFPCPVDIVLMNSDWYEKTKDVIGGLAYPAAKYGRILHAA